MPAHEEPQPSPPAIAARSGASTKQLADSWVGAPSALIGRDSLRHDDALAGQLARCVRRRVDAHPAISTALVQREVFWHSDRRISDRKLDEFVKTLDKHVQEGARMALDPESIAEDTKEKGGYLERWRKTGMKLLAARTSSGDTPASHVLGGMPFARAHYGYAVETLACADVDALEKAVPPGCSLELQGSRGMSRPDVIVTEGKKDIGWFDITSARDHIFKKTHTGWRTRPYVAEILYAPLVLSEIGKSRLTEAERRRLKKAAKRADKAWEKLVSKTKAEFEKAWIDGGGSASTNRKTTQSITRIAAASAVRDIEPLVESASLPATSKPTVLTPRDTLALLRAWGVNVQRYGFKQGGTKSRGHQILRGALPDVPATNEKRASDEPDGARAKRLRVASPSSTSSEEKDDDPEVEFDDPPDVEIADADDEDEEYVPEDR